MEDVDVKEFDAFLERNWGIKAPKREDEIEKEEQEKAEAEAKAKAEAEAKAKAEARARAQAQARAQAVRNQTAQAGSAEVKKPAKPANDTGEDK